MDVVFSILIVRRGAAGARVWEEASVYCVHPVAVLNNAFCMTSSLLMLVEDAMGQ